MAVTGAIYKTLEFDGESSAGYGVYITGQAVYNAPQRDVEMVSIYGRNGAFALDNGRFENITVTYPAGIFAENETDFAKAISDFRNFLCSKKGYVKLTDDYNPTEYRMAIYKSGLEVEPTMAKAGEFEIVFECKPQRFLMSGETPIDVTTGDTILNPTPFDAQPLLEVEGYGDINIEGYNIGIVNDAVGYIELLPAYSGSSSAVRRSDNAVLVEPTDTQTLSSFKVKTTFVPYNTQNITKVQPSSINRTASNISNYAGQTDAQETETRLSFTISYGEQTRLKNAGTVSATDTFTIGIRVTDSGGTATIYTVTLTIEIVTTAAHLQVYASVASVPSFISRSVEFDIAAWTADSTQSVLGTPTYVDCEIGEAYKEVNNMPVSLNKYIDLGSDLPVLASGSNYITYDNTITDLKIIPRWWKI